MKSILSIIIVHYKTRELTIQCLKSVRTFSPHIAYEVIVVDNGSQDGIRKEVAEYFPEVKLIDSGQNVGFSRANNLGIVNAQGQYILLLNSDTKMIEPIFEQLIEYMDTNPDTGAIGPRHLWEDGSFQVSYGRFPTLCTEILRNIIQHRISSKRDVDWLSGSCLLLRRDALCQSGILDEAFFMYLEDVDLCTRIRNKKWRVCYFPEAAIMHYHGRSVKENAAMSRFEYRRSQIHFSRKYYGKVGELLMRFFVFLKVLISCKGIGRVFLLRAEPPIEPILKE